MLCCKIFVSSYKGVYGSYSCFNYIAKASYYSQSQKLPFSQRQSIKNRYPNHVIFFRLGAFYELFDEGDDAIIGEKILHLRINSLSRAGFPYFSLKYFAPKLLQSGYKIAMVEETKIVKRKNKEFRDRQMICLLSPGTYLPLNTEPDQESMETLHYASHDQQLIVCIAMVDDYPLQLNVKLNTNPIDSHLINDKEEKIALIACDLSTGEMDIFDTNISNLTHDISRLNPIEILLCDSFHSKSSMASETNEKLMQSLNDMCNCITFASDVLPLPSTINDKSRMMNSLDYDTEVSSVDWFLDNEEFYSNCNISNDWEISDILNAYVQCGMISNSLQLSSMCLLLAYFRECRTVTSSMLLNLARSHSINEENRNSMCDSLQLDTVTRQSLEIHYPMNRDITQRKIHGKNSLVNVLNCTKTSAGKRLLIRRLSMPSTNVSEIENRVLLFLKAFVFYFSFFKLDVIQYLRRNQILLQTLPSKLKSIGDFQRNIQPLLNGTHVSIECLKQMANRILNIQTDIIENMTSSAVPMSDSEKSDFFRLLLCLSSPVSIFQKSEELFTGEHILSPSIINWAENVIAQCTGLKSGSPKESKWNLWNVQLNECNIDSIHCQQILIDIKQKINIMSIDKYLKLKNDKLFGFCFQINPKYIVKDIDDICDKCALTVVKTTKTSILLKYELLNQMEYKYKEAQNEMKNFKKNLAKTMVKELLMINNTDIHLSADLQNLGLFLANLDLSCGLAQLSLDRNYIRPEIVQFDDGHSHCLEIIGGRHPIVEQNMRTGMSFIPNDCRMSSNFWSMSHLDSNFVHIITGANMSGKSIFLRQQSLLVIMAQSGMYVPCTSMKFSLVDAIFSRVGCSDEISNNESSFMREMNECAYILKNASEKSLIIMDEVGRGTSPKEGECIAQSILKYIHDDIQCRALFATHFVNCTSLEMKGISGLKYLKNYCFLSGSDMDRSSNVISFNYKLSEGVCYDSQALLIAEMAGIPSSIVQNAKELISEERKQQKN